MGENNHFVCPSCGKSVGKNLNFCTFCGASLSEQIKTKNSSEEFTQMGISEEDRANLKRLLEIKDEKEIAKLIRDLFKKSSSNKDYLTEMYDLIGEMMIKDKKFFKDRLYRRLNKKSSSYFRTEMEKYILKKYSFYEGEKIILSTNGDLSLGSHWIHGNLYVTNQRMIMCGTLKKQGGDVDGSGTEGDIIIVIIWIFAIFYFAARWALTPWKKILRTQINQKKPCFGYEFPFVEVQDIKLKKSKIKFKLKYEYNYKGKVKTKIIKLKFSPSRLFTERFKMEPKEIYRERRKKFISKFHEFLTQL